MSSMNLKQVVKEIMTNGPDRVMVAPGEATSSIRARRDYRVMPDIIFIRNDGWSLASPDYMEMAAYAMWADLWIGFIRRPEITVRPIAEYRRMLEAIK